SGGFERTSVFSFSLFQKNRIFSAKFSHESADEEGMLTDTVSPEPRCKPLSLRQIEFALENCPCLPSLGSIDGALKGLLSADHRYTSQIAEIIRRDPSLTLRLLRLVNSVYYGRGEEAKSIEEAVFFLGVRQIRELAMITPVIEDLQRLGGNHRFAWRDLWRHCIGTAILTREIIHLAQSTNEDLHYLGGLIHDVGKIVMAAAFPKHFDAIHQRHQETGEDLLLIEMEILGMDHTDLGAFYLRKQNLPQVFVAVAQFHHQPETANNHKVVVAAVHVADLVVRHARIGHSGNHAVVEEDSWLETAGWKILFENQTEAGRAITHASLKRKLERIPSILEGLV
ncbi:MAG: HDOD domain-containing protein, partial [Verrucomicrobiota bacterium]